MTVNIPNLTEKIERRIDRNLNKVRDVVPAVVETVHKEKMKVDVFVKTKWSDKPTFIKNVRVIYPQSNDSKILYGLSRGDTVLLLFSKFDMISLQNKGLTNVDETPTWESKNVVALPGIHLDQLLQDEYDESSIQGHDVEIPDGLKILSNGNIYLNGEEIFVNDVNVEEFITFFGLSFFLSDENSGINDPDDSEYKNAKLIYEETAEASISATGNDVDDYHIQSWILNSEYVSEKLYEGVYALKIDAERTSGSRDVRLFFDIYERKDDGTEELIKRSGTSELVGDRKSFLIPIRLNEIELSTDSRVVFKLYMRREEAPSSDEITVYYNGETDSNITFPTSTETLDKIYALKDDLVDVSDDGLPIVSNVSDINFGSNINVNDDEDGTVTVTTPEDTHIDVEEDGGSTASYTDIDKLNIETGLNTSSSNGTVTIETDSAVKQELVSQSLEKFTTTKSVLGGNVGSSYHSAEIDITKGKLLVQIDYEFTGDNTGGNIKLEKNGTVIDTFVTTTSNEKGKTFLVIDIDKTLDDMTTDTYSIRLEANYDAECYLYETRYKQTLRDV